MNILLLEPPPAIQPSHLTYLTDAGHTLIPYGTQPPPEHIHAIIIRTHTQVTPTLLDQFPNLQYVCRVGVGLDNVDLDACRSRGVQVHNTPGANASAVASLAIRGLLSLLRKSHLAAQSLATINIIPDRYQFLGQEISQRRIGMIGYGQIAQIITHRLQAFDAQTIHAYDPFLTISQQDIQQVHSLPELYSHSDVLFLCVPLTQQTHHMCDTAFFGQAPEDLILINTSRGDLVQEPALYEFLNKNHQAAYYGDVRANEPTRTSILDQLLTLPNYLLTPHIGAMTDQATQNMHFFSIFTKDINAQ